MSRPKLADPEQMTICDVEPENVKNIMRLARAYRRAQGERMEAGEQEVKYKQQLLEEAKRSGIVPNTDGSYKFRAGTCTITVKPRDELIKVKFDESDDDDGDEE